MNALELQKVNKIYPTGLAALQEVDLAIEPGDFFALLGPNGAGKTTLIGIVSSLVKKTSGIVSVFGYDMDRDPRKTKLLMGMIPQEFNFNFFERVIDVLINQAGYYGISRAIAYDRAEHFLSKLGLWNKRNQVSRELSGGMKRRLMIARGLVHYPKILILDEPTAGVDIELRRSMWEFLQEINRQGTTILLTTHYLEEAESLCRGAAILHQGRIIKKASIKELLSDLKTETLLFDLQSPVREIPVIDGCRVIMVDELTLEITFPKRFSINQICAELSKQNIEASGMRNKSNRLEECLINLVKKNDAVY